MCLEAENVGHIDGVEPPEPPFTEADMIAYITALYYGFISTYTPSLSLYGKHISYLMGGVSKGFGGLSGSHSFGTGLNQTSLKLESSIWRFSAAKQYQLNREMSGAIFKAMPFDEFKPLAVKIWDKQNLQYLKNEWMTGVIQAQNARNWVDLMDDEGTQYLTYRTQRNNRVRPSHRLLEGITRHKNDAFWNYYHPAMDWNCHCFVTRHEKKKETDLSKRKIGKFGENESFPIEFKMNPGKDQFIFSKRHPYYNVPRKDTGLKKNNFNLPLPNDKL